MGFFAKLLGGNKTPDGRLPLGELVRRLKTDESALAALRVHYSPMQIPKRSGGLRQLHVPDKALADLQRTILHRLLAKLPVHPAATAFGKGKSVVTNAGPHCRKPLIIKLDVMDFFGTTTAARVEDYFRTIGWNRQAAKRLTELTTLNGGLPQGAPTSPALSNLVNYQMDVRMAALAQKAGAAYTRYADDITFSFGESATRQMAALVIFRARKTLMDFGYRMHRGRKLRMVRSHQQQIVTGLVVNQKPNLSRKTRRWLRAVEHHVAKGKEATLTPQQLAGWQALRKMIHQQTTAGK